MIGGHVKVFSPVVLCWQARILTALELEEGRSGSKAGEKSRQIAALPLSPGTSPPLAGASQLPHGPSSKPCFQENA